MCVRAHVRARHVRASACACERMCVRARLEAALDRVLRGLAADVDQVKVLAVLRRQRLERRQRRVDRRHTGLRRRGSMGGAVALVRRDCDYARFDFDLG